MNAVLGAARTFETQIDNLPLQCSLLLAYFICAPTLSQVLLEHLKHTSIDYHYSVAYS